MGRPRAAGQRPASDTPARAPRRPGRPGGGVAAPAQPRPRNSRQPGPPNRSQLSSPYHTGRGHPTTRIVSSVKCTSEPEPWPGQGHRPDSSKRTGPKDLEPGRQHAQYPEGSAGPATCLCQAHAGARATDWPLNQEYGRRHTQYPADPATCNCQAHAGARAT
jgi:hypothetical protein